MRKVRRLLTGMFLVCELMLATSGMAQNTGNHHKKNLLPEPATILLLGTGLGGIWLVRKRFKQ